MAMTIQERILDSSQKFEQKKAEREQHVQMAEECLTEMAKLQGEYRVLNKILAEEKPKKANKEATVIEAVPEEDK